jgi:hypothetical protein
MCDISVAVGVISMINATCGTGPYLPSLQITTKYKIRTKYDDNLRLYKNRESRKTPFV